MCPIRISFSSGSNVWGKNLEKFSKHIYLLLLIPLILIAHELGGPGIIIAQDFPFLDTPEYAIHRLWLWLDRGSIDGFEFVPRFPIIGLLYMLGFVGLHSDLATKAMVLLGFSLSSFSFYFSYLSFLGSRYTGLKTLLRISGLLGSLFYAYNVWSFNRIHHWYLWLGYAILPLFFISIYFTFKRTNNWKYIIASIFLWTIASSTPHMALFYGVILIVAFLGFLSHALYKNTKKGMIQYVKGMFLIFVLYILVNMYWIYPYILSSQSGVVSPNYELTEEVIQLLSREGNFLNTVRILAYWLNSDVQTFGDSFLSTLWLLASFTVPVVAFLSLFVRKLLKFSVIFIGIALIGILLAMGSNSPLKYHTLILSSPSLSEFAWLLRDSDKLSFATTFAYSILVGLTSWKILSSISNRHNDKKIKLILSSLFLFLIVGSIFLTSYPFYQARTEQLKPIVLPTEFDRLNGYLSKVNTDKVYFVPYPLYETNWKTNSRVGDIYQTHVIKPSIESTEYNLFSSNHYNYIIDHMLENRSKKIGNSIFPLGTSYLIFHNDTWSKVRDTYDQNSIDLLNKLTSLEELKNYSSVGFYKLFKINDSKSNQNTGQVNIPSHNIAVTSGLDTLASLDSIPYFNSKNSSLLFLDDNIAKNVDRFEPQFDELILGRLSSLDDLVLSFVDEKYLLSPFDATYRHDPSLVWSKSRARDPVHAEYHPTLNSLGITNWDLDYGKGLVMTKAKGTNLTIPINIQDEANNGEIKDSNYYLFIRYLQNQKGGQIKIYVDNKLIQNLDTRDKIADKFVWQKVDLLNLTKGRHTIQLENAVGFNAVNLFAIVPLNEIERIGTVVNNTLNGRTKVIYLMEAESNFYNNKGINIDNFLLDGNNNNSMNTLTSDKNGNIKTLKGEFKAPSNSDLVGFQFFVKKNDTINETFSINKLDIYPANQKYDVFGANFEPEREYVPLGALRKFSWVNYDKDLQSTALEKTSNSDGNYSLKVTLKQSNKDGWNVLSSDLVPISDRAYYIGNLDVVASDVKRLHSRILYFDSYGKEMSGSTDYISSGILPPLGAKYLKVQILTMSANPKSSTFVLDNVKIDEIVDFNPVTKGIIHLHERPDLIYNQGNYSDPMNNTSGSVFQTSPFTVRPNNTYNYVMTTKNMYSPIALFKNSQDIVENATRYGNNASNGRVLVLGNGSEIQSTIEVIKSSNYSIAVRAESCEICTYLNVSITSVDKDGNIHNYNIYEDSISLKNEDTGLKWISSNNTYYLNKGTYDVNIYSDSKTDLDSVLLFENDNTQSAGKTDSRGGIGNLFTFSSPAAKLAGFKKIDPTKYVIYIENATRPYTVSLAEGYDPLWTAYIESGENKSNFRISSYPFYGVVNGFYLNKTGNYSLVLEYQPQTWFIQGATISIFTLFLILVISIIWHKNMMVHKLKSSITSIKKYFQNKSNE